MLRHRQLPVVMSVLVALFAAGCSSSTAPEEKASGAYDVTKLFTEEEAVVARDGSTTNLRLLGVRYDLGTADLTAESLPYLDRFREVFENLPGATFSVEVHTDSRGASTANLRITQERADAVRAYLVKEVGGPEEAITAVGHGEDFPIDNNRTAAGRAVNRRTEIVVAEPVGAG